MEEKKKKILERERWKKMTQQPMQFSHEIENNENRINIKVIKWDKCVG